MINISKLYCGEPTPGDWLRYGEPDSCAARKGGPVVVWNITRACNLRCLHCYSDSGPARAADELSSGEAKAVLDDLARFAVPAVLFSGGEPLMRPDLFELLEYAAAIGLPTVISTNGTLINADVAEKIKRCSVGYVGISLDGIGAVNDRFRAVYGAFDKASAGIRNCRDAGVRVGIRVTLTRSNIGDLQRLLDFFEAQGIERICFYHLVPTGRAMDMAGESLTHIETKRAVDTILAGARQMNRTGRKTDILTVDNHVDGVYLYLKLLEEKSPRAEDVRRLLKRNGGALNSSGVGIGCIDPSGMVHPDQFWSRYDLGSVRKRPFSRIWTDDDEPLLRELRNRRSYIKGRCRLCKFFDACGGGNRVRAQVHFADRWAPEPACYLTDEQIGLDDRKRKQLTETGEIFPMPD